MTPAPGRSLPSGPGEGGKGRGAKGPHPSTPRRGGGCRRNLPDSAAAGLARGALSRRGRRLPCIPAPGHSPRSERTGCRPPWSRQPAKRRASAGRALGRGRRPAPGPAAPPPFPEPTGPRECAERARGGSPRAGSRGRGDSVARRSLGGPGAGAGGREPRACGSGLLGFRPKGRQRSAGPGGGGAWKPVSLQKRGVRATAPGTGPHPDAPCP